MTAIYNLEWDTQLQPVQIFAIGDVLPVLNSTASTLSPIPAIKYGLGALTSSGPDLAGEGIIFRYRVGITPPLPKAGVELEYYPSGQQISTPFCLGWKGEFTAQGWFKTDSGIMLRSIYETLFQEAQSRFGDIYIILIEVVGLLPIAHIFDRALKKPVHQGNVLITSPEYQNEYFRAKIIHQDTSAQKIPETELLPMGIVGVGYFPGGAHPSLKRLEQAVFYTPPTLGKGIPQTYSPIKTHNHAIGWKDSSLSQLLLSASQDEKSVTINSFDEQIEQTSASKPSYIVHLDEWSQLNLGHLRVFVATPEAIRFE